MEVWKEVQGTDGKYLISSKGRLKSLCRKKPLLVKYFEDKDGYFKYGIKRKNKLIHRLVALAFIPNPDNKPEVNHKDGDKQNNNIENLEWATRSENQKHAFENGLQVAECGVKKWSSKLNKEKVKQILKLKGVLTQQKIADKFSVSQSVINDVVNRKSWKHINI